MGRELGLERDGGEWVFWGVIGAPCPGGGIDLLGFPCVPAGVSGGVGPAWPWAIEDGWPEERLAPLGEPAYFAG